MAPQIRSMDKSTIVYGLLAAAIGLFYMLFSFGVIRASGHAASQGSILLGFCVGLAFFAGGLAVVIQSIEGAAAAPDGSLSPTIPTWARLAMHVLALAVTVCLAAIGLWVAFGPGPRGFATSVPFLGHRITELAGRAAFGFGAVLICLVLLVIAFEGVVRLLGRAKSRLKA